MTSNLLDVELEDILATTMAEGGGELLVVNPAGDTIEAVVNVATSFDGEPPSIRLQADERTLKDVMDDFIVASNAADLIEEDVLELRTLREIPENSLLITEERVIAIVQAGSQVGGLTAEAGSFVDAAHETYSDHWERAHPFSLRTPPLSRVRRTLSEEISADVEEDFTSVLDSLETARGNGEGLDEVTISLLVAAKNEALLYDISKWGEDVGIASKATFSRTKTKLEDMDLLDTEKVPIDVGRPRLRLKLGDDRLRDADSDQLASVAQSLLN
jgi:hypothetical protein